MMGASPSGGLIEQDHCGRAISPRPIASICCSPPDMLPAVDASARATGETCQIRFHPILDTVARARRDPAEAQILLDGEERKDQPAFGNEYDSTVDTPVRRDIDNLPALEAHAARPRGMSPASVRISVVFPAPLAPIKR